MFDELIREIKKLSEPREISISIPLDDKRFYDRECPNTECEGAFKVLFDDWRDKVLDERVFCPFCRYEAPSDQWHNGEQIEHIQTAALAEMSRLVQGALRKGVSRSRPTNISGGLIGISMTLDYRPGRIPVVIPAQASDELRQEFTCEACNCRYASVGASFFCPACGHNSATSSFDNTLDTVRKTIGCLEPMRLTIEKTGNADVAKDAVRQILEDQFARLVGAFERLNEALFVKLPGAAGITWKGAVFQRVDDASELWRQATGKSYADFVDEVELQRMKLFFQRRHVLSHCQGIVDQAYCTKSGDPTYAIGQRLVVQDGDVLELVEILDKLAAGLRTLAAAAGS